MNDEKQSGWVNGGAQPTLPYSNGDTSVDAATSMLGSASSLRRLVFDTIKHLGGLTDDEIEVETGLSHQTASARRRELVLSKNIVFSGERRRTRSGRFAKVHVVSDER